MPPSDLLHFSHLALTPGVTVGAYSLRMAASTAPPSLSNIDLDRDCIEALERAVAVAFPNRDRLILREVVRWFWDTDLPSPPETRCSFCQRDVAGIEAADQTRICRFCVAYYHERNATAVPLPEAEMILSDVLRAIRALAPADVATRLAGALDRRHGIARPQPLLPGRCSSCRGTSSETVNAGTARLCLHCIRTLATAPA